MSRDCLMRLQEWYASHCDGEWEHRFGVKVETLDNPGWRLEVDLDGTELEKDKFEAIDCARSDIDWFTCRVRAKKFEGFGGALNMEDLIETFLGWAMSDNHSNVGSLR